MNAMNNFTIAGFVINDAEVKNFEKASIARFGLAVRTTEKKGDKEVKKSSILNLETWVKNSDTTTLAMLKKGTLSINMRIRLIPTLRKARRTKKRHCIKAELVNKKPS